MRLFSWSEIPPKRSAQRPGSATPRHGWTDCNPDAVAGFAAAGWFGDVILTQSQKSPADPDELAVTAGLPLGWECTRETLQTPETPRRPNSTEGNEGNKDGSALRFRCLLFKTSEYSALCTPPNDQLTHSRQKKVSAANRATELPVMLATVQRGGCWVQGLGGIAGKIARDIMAFSVHLVLGGSVFFF